MPRRKHPINEMCPKCREQAVRLMERLPPDSASHFSLSMDNADLRCRILQLERQLEFERESTKQWKELALSGYPAPMKLWMETEVWKASCKPTAAKIRRCYADLERATRKWFEREDL